MHKHEWTSTVSDYQGTPTLQELCECGAKNTIHPQVALTMAFNKIGNRIRREYRPAPANLMKRYQKAIDNAGSLPKMDDAGRDDPEPAAEPRDVIHIGMGSSSKTECGRDNPAMMATPWRDATCWHCLEKYGLRNIREGEAILETGKAARDAAQKRGIWVENIPA